MEINNYQKEFAEVIKNINNHPIVGDSILPEAFGENTTRVLIILDSTNAIAAEAGELANVGKKIYRSKFYGYKGKKYSLVDENQLKEEFADVLSNCLEMACRMGWSIEEILLEKLKYKQDIAKLKQY